MLLGLIGLGAMKQEREMKILIFILMFFVLGTLLIISNNNLSMHNHEDTVVFSKLFVGWMDNIFSNFKTLTGNTGKLDWMPE